MARVKGPLFSMEASGTIGGAIVFSKWKGRDYVRRHAIPSNPKSGLQTGVRAVFGFIAQDYANLGDADIADWQELAAGDNITPLNAQIRDAVDKARRNLGWRENTTDAPAAAVDAPTEGAATAQPSTLVLGWTDPVSNAPDYCYAIYRGAAGDFTPDISNLIAVVPAAQTSYTDVGLTAGTTYHYKVRGLSTGGKLGTLSDSFSGTPTT